MQAQADMRKERNERVAVEKPRRHGDMASEDRTGRYWVMDENAIIVFDSCRHCDGQMSCSRCRASAIEHDEWVRRREDAARCTPALRTHVKRSRGRAGERLRHIHSLGLISDEKGAQLVASAEARRIHMMDEDQRVRCLRKACICVVAVVSDICASGLGHGRSLTNRAVRVRMVSSTPSTCLVVPMEVRAPWPSKSTSPKLGAITDHAGNGIELVLRPEDAGNSTHDLSPWRRAEKDRVGGGGSSK